MATVTSKEKFSPGLFDLTQDINGGLPLQVIGQWMDSPQNQDAARALLKQHEVTGYSVSSDTAGLTKLTKQFGLLEILAVINRPKEIVYRFGSAVGGQGLGVWAADNTQMFYPPAVSAATLLSALLAAQDEINRSCRVKIGLGAHYGDFYLLSGGLYGAQADAIEELAENETEGGEIVITESIWARLPAGHGFTLVERDGHSSPLGRVFRVTDGPRLGAPPESGGHYPIPYSKPFYAALVEYQDRLDDAAFGERLAAEHLQNKAVVLVERAGLEAEAQEVGLFQNLSTSALLKDMGQRALPATGAQEIKVSGPIGIYTFDEAETAIVFADECRRALAAEDVACRIGIDAGPVLVFDLPTGGRDIAGMPVNVASKMAQDKGRMGKVYLSAAAKQALPASFNSQTLTELRYTVSGVEMVAYEC
jgi:class 3 adenylate cyclase